jgi:hypothetical protein
MDASASFPSVLCMLIEPADPGAAGCAATAVRPVEPTTVAAFPCTRYPPTLLPKLLAGRLAP